jgi:hypothetical protein
MSKTKTIVESTVDHGKFQDLTGNRVINNAHKNRLKTAYAVDPTVAKYNPILINEKWEIIDGQHRFRALKELNSPIYFIQEPGLTLQVAQDLNAGSKPWTPKDYAESIVEVGGKNVPPYEEYLLLKDQYGLNHDVLMRFIAQDTPISTDAFKRGKLQMPDKKATEDLCKKLSDIGAYCTNYKLRAFAFAFAKMTKSKHYKHDQFVKNLAKLQVDIPDYSDPIQYQNEFNKIYNSHLTKDKRVTLFA